FFAEQPSTLSTANEEDAEGKLRVRDVCLTRAAALVAASCTQPANLGVDWVEKFAAVTEADLRLLVEVKAALIAGVSYFEAYPSPDASPGRHALADVCKRISHDVGLYYDRLFGFDPLRNLSSAEAVQSAPLPQRPTACLYTGKYWTVELDGESRTEESRVG